MVKSELLAPPEGDKLRIVRIGPDGTGCAVECAAQEILRDPARASGSSHALCVAFLPPGAGLANAQALVRWFDDDARLAAVALCRVSRTGEMLASTARAPALRVLMHRALLGCPSTRARRTPGSPIEGFAHDRTLSVEVVHPWAWAVRTADWTGTKFAPALSWEYAVQVFIDGLTARGAEVFYVSNVGVREINVLADPWCHPRRALADLKGLFAYVRERWGGLTAALFRWCFKPLFLGRILLELPVRAVRPARNDPGRFHVTDLFRFLAAT